MDITLFDFALPERLIAQHPVARRDQSRLFALDKTTGSMTHHRFADISDFLRPGDVLVRNNTKVIPARLIGVKHGTGAHVELLLLKSLGADIYECLVGNSRTVKLATEVVFGSGELRAVCTSVFPEGIRHMRFHYDGVFLEVLDRLGTMPLPPYIHEKLTDKARYQTVYAALPGSAAGPTAGFHFTPELLERICAKGIIIVDVTLHIGLATFRPVKVRDTSDHRMHHEEYELSAEAAQTLNDAKRDGRRIIAIGTTSTRALEANIGKYQTFTAAKESTDIFIQPGRAFKAIDAIITNFHLPKSTLIMMMAAFAGLDLIKAAYQEAIEKEYRFFSFGDAMFIYAT